MLQRRVVQFSILLSALAGFSGPIRAQGVEVEPNDSCPGAQVLGTIALPFTLTGSLTPTQSPDIDFFAIDAVPGQLLQIELLTAESSSGLSDPFLGVFNSGCINVAVDDDGGESLNSRLRFFVPPDGHLRVAATACCDYGFTGTFSAGDYLLRITEVEPAGPLTGRLVDARSGLPLTSDFPQYAYAVLYQCDFNSCFQYINTAYPDADGRIEFTQNYYGEPLFSDHYKLYASADGYETYESEIFELTPAGLDRGDVEVSPLRFIGSISGRLVDALDGRPLTNSAPDYATLQLRFCPSPGFCNPVAEGVPDSQGRFTIDGRANFLLEGEYIAVGFSAQAEPAETDFFFVAEAENLDLGDIALTPNPIQLSLQQGCGNIPASGGTCRFTLRARNGTNKRMSGYVWAAVEGYGTSSAFSFTRFQLGKVGTANPMPQRFNLKSSQAQLFDFALDIPASVRPGASLCVIGFAGADPAPQLNVQADQGFLLCITKEQSEFRVLTGKHAREKMKTLRNH